MKKILCIILPCLITLGLLLQVGRINVRAIEITNPPTQNLALMSQSEAQAGIGTIARSVSSLRLTQAIAAYLLAGPTIANPILTGAATLPSDEVTSGTKTVTVAPNSSFVIATSGSGTQFRKIEGVNYKLPVTLYNFCGSVTVTGTTTETTLATVSIPGGVIKANSLVECYFVFSSVVGTSSTRTYKSTGHFGNSMLSVTPSATHTTASYLSQIICLGSTTSQIVRPGSYTYDGTSNSALISKSIDITGTITIGCSGTLSNAANDITLHLFRVVLYE